MISSRINPNQIFLIPNKKHGDARSASVNSKPNIIDRWFCFDYIAHLPTCNHF